MKSPRQYQPLLAGEGERGYGSIQRSLSPKHFFRSEPPPPPPTRKRFYMLFLFFMACFAQGIVWTPLSSLPTEAKLWFPVLTEVDIYWSLNMGPLFYLPFSIMAPWLLSRRNGMQKSVRVGMLFSLLSALIRVPVALSSLAFRSSVWCNVMMQLAGAFCGAAGPFTQGSPSRFAAIWFPEEERTRATAVGFLGTYLGTASSYIIAPAIVRVPSDYPALLWVELAVVGVPTLLVMLHFPDSPDKSQQGQGQGQERGEGQGEEQQEEKEGSFIEGLRQLGTNGPFMLLMLSIGFLHGVYATWGVSLALLLQPLGFKSSEADMFSFSTTVLYVLGSYAVGEISDRFFRRRFKALICLLLVLVIGSFVSFLLSVRSVWLPNGPILTATYSQQMAAICLHGLFIGCTAPPAFELAAELTHPVPEGTSANMIGLVINTSHVLSLAAFAYLSPLAINPLLAVVYCCCLVLMLVVCERYLRSDEDERAELAYTAHINSHEDLWPQAVTTTNAQL